MPISIHLDLDANTVEISGTSAPLAVMPYSRRHAEAMRNWQDRKLLLRVELNERSRADRLDEIRTLFDAAGRPVDDEDLAVMDIVERDGEFTVISLVNDVALLVERAPGVWFTGDDETHWDCWLRAHPRLERARLEGQLEALGECGTLYPKRTGADNRDARLAEIRSIFEERNIRAADEDWPHLDFVWRYGKRIIRNTATLADLRIESSPGCWWRAPDSESTAVRSGMPQLPSVRERTEPPLTVEIKNPQPDVREASSRPRTHLERLEEIRAILAGQKREFWPKEVAVMDFDIRGGKRVIVSLANDTAFFVEKSPGVWGRVDVDVWDEGECIGYPLLTHSKADEMADSFGGSLWPRRTGSPFWKVRCAQLREALADAGFPTEGLQIRHFDFVQRNGRRLIRNVETVTDLFIETSPGCWRPVQTSLEGRSPDGAADAAAGAGTAPAEAGSNS